MSENINNAPAGFPMMKVKDSGNDKEMMMMLLSTRVFTEYLSKDELEIMATFIGPASAVNAHPSVKLAYNSRSTLQKQAEQLKIVSPALSEDLQTRTKAFQPGGRYAVMTHEEKKRLSRVPLNNDASERPLGLVGEEQRSKPNERLATSEATAMAKINDPWSYIAERTEEEKDEIWVKARAEEKIETERRKQELAKMEREKQEKMRKTIDAAKLREAKQAKTEAEFKDEEPINTVEELQEHLAGLDDSVKTDVLRDQIRNWNSKGVTKKEIAIGADDKPEQLQNKLERFLERKLTKAMEARPEPPKRKRKATSSNDTKAAKKQKTEIDQKQQTRERDRGSKRGRPATKGKGKASKKESKPKMAKLSAKHGKGGQTEKTAAKGKAKTQPPMKS